ncbi:MAG: hypothetical protein RR338_01805, partial [Clostridia bacterium]
MTAQTYDPLMYQFLGWYSNFGLTGETLLSSNPDFNIVVKDNVKIVGVFKQLTTMPPVSISSGSLDSTVLNGDKTIVQKLGTTADYVFTFGTIPSNITIKAYVGSNTYLMTNSILTVPGISADTTIRLVAKSSNEQSIDKVYLINIQVLKIFPTDLVIDGSIPYSQISNNSVFPFEHDKSETSYTAYKSVHTTRGNYGITVKLTESGVFSFSFKTDLPDSSQNTLEVYMNGTRIVNYQGINDWGDISFYVPQGENTITLNYNRSTYIEPTKQEVVWLANFSFSKLIIIGGDGITELNAKVLSNIETLMQKVPSGGLYYLYNTDLMSTQFVKLNYANPASPQFEVISVECPSGVTSNFVDGVYKFSGLKAGDNKIKFVCANNKNFTLIVNNKGLAGFDNIIDGRGTVASPYIITDIKDIEAMRVYPDKYFKLGENLTYTGFVANINNGTKVVTINGVWSPIGNSAAPFMGGFDGSGWKFIIGEIAAVSDRGFFGVTSNAVLKNFNIDISAIGTNSTLGGVVGAAINSLNCENVNVTANFSVDSENLGGLVGTASSRAVFKNCKVDGKINNLKRNNTGGLTGNGGTFENCVVYADVSGILLVGGLVGGYQATAYFTDCDMAGTVSIKGNHTNNYPYVGYLNGYGAHVTFVMQRTGVLLRVTFNHLDKVKNIEVFNSEFGATVVSQTDNGNGTSTIVFRVCLESVYASSSLLSETKVNGVTGNYGGFVVRFEMLDGTYKYVGTLDKESTIYKSNLNVDLDRLVSYQDNFKTMAINAMGTTDRKTENVNGKQISIFGSVVANNENDFEHLQWHINGGIPTTFAGGIYYNARSIATLSVSLGADLDLTKERLVNGKYLNRVGGLIGGEILNQFYGFGTSEMNPYRGSIYGNNHTLNVNMNFPEAYLVGIIAMSSDMDYQVVVSNLTVTGTIIGKYRVGVVGMFDAYCRSGTLKFDNVTNKATMSATEHIGGLIGVSHQANIYVNNCVIQSNISGGQRGSIAGSNGNWSYASNISYTGKNKDYTLLPFHGSAKLQQNSTNGFAFISRVVKLHYGTADGEFIELSTNNAMQTSFSVNLISVGGMTYTFNPVTFVFNDGGGNFKKDFYIFILTGSLSKAYDGNAEFALGASNYLGTWTVNGNVVVGGVNASATAYDVFQTNNLTFGAVDTASVNIVNAGLTATITKKNVTASVANNTVTYNGKDQTTATISGEGFVASEISGGVATFLNHTYSATPKSAGKYTITVTLTVAASNYALTGATVFDYIVNKAEIAVTMPSGYATEKTYGGVDPVWADININGVALEPSGFEQVPVKFSRTGADQTAGVKVGDITASTTNQNYALNFTAKDFTIKQATPVLTFANATFSYNGNAQSLENATIAGVAGAENPTGAITYTYYAEQACATAIAKPTNVGVYYVRASYAGDNNYTAVTADATLTITAIAPTVSVAPSASGICVGQTLADSKLTGGVIKGANNEDVVGTFAWKDGTVKPTATASGSYKIVFTTA